MVRKFKHHEEKLLKKVDFLSWKNENSMESTIVARYKLHDRESYVKYNKICGQITKLASLISCLDPQDPFRKKIATQILEKLYSCGFINHKNTVSQLSRVSVTSFCKRRLANVLLSLKMCQHLEESVTLIQHGHIRIGPDTVTDPSFLVTRSMEDFITWKDESKIRRKIATYYDETDDFDLNSR